MLMHITIPNWFKKEKTDPPRQIENLPNSIVPLRLIENSKLVAVLLRSGSRSDHHAWPEKAGEFYPNDKGERNKNKAITAILINYLLMVRFLVYYHL